MDFESLKNRPWDETNPCFECDSDCCKKAEIPVNQEEYQRLFPNHTLYLKATSGAGIVQVKSCPHLDTASRKCLAFLKPEACRKAPASPHEVKFVSPKCRFPTDDNTKQLWFENQLPAILSSK